MPPPRDLDDTADLTLNAASRSGTRAKIAENTDELEIAGGREPSQPDTPSSQPHPYAQGIIRFYRARTILLVERHEGRHAKAWTYLSRLRPHDLPKSVRRDFFELVYFMHEQAGRPQFESEAFSSRVLAIAGRIDEFVDALTGNHDV
jgi:hypothetical protein